MPKSNNNSGLLRFVKNHSPTLHLEPFHGIILGKRGYAGNDELLAGMARSMSGSKYFSGTASLKEFIISHGDFIYKQLIGLDTMLKANDKGIEDIPALIALRDESKKQAHFANTQVRPSNATLRMLHLRPH
ncbi:hypothetical protein KIW84_030330 [Lathyrus oleraceus]|uniref:Uncharacterized protein n=1 Tax=Pisum sativum TaxID=3888 RepID=A0A9D5AW29_PEA|nr:hypothetical protein KIW84_030330 [Pisum sativum]